MLLVFRPAQVLLVLPFEGRVGLCKEKCWTWLGIENILPASRTPKAQSLKLTTPKTIPYINPVINPTVVSIFFPIIPESFPWNRNRKPHAGGEPPESWKDTRCGRGKACSADCTMGGSIQASWCRVWGLWGFQSWRSSGPGSGT